MVKGCWAGRRRRTGALAGLGREGAAGGGKGTCAGAGGAGRADESDRRHGASPEGIGGNQRDSGAVSLCPADRVPESGISRALGTGTSGAAAAASDPAARSGGAAVIVGAGAYPLLRQR